MYFSLLVMSTQVEVDGEIMLSLLLTMLMQQMDHKGEITWLYPFVQLHDFLVASAMILEEAMICEHDDFEGPLFFFRGLLKNPTGGEIRIGE